MTILPRWFFRASSRLYSFSALIASKTQSASKKLFVGKTMQEGRRSSQLGPYVI
ncbi:MAG: hypothetical protein IKW83_00385 [Muribaculaceae bacterium]|nr:hypothetical protein [Muribaculaceae bacterium]